MTRLAEHNIQFGHRPGGADPSALVIAEAGVNHNGDPELARRLVVEAASSGANAVKFQTFKAERLASAIAPKAEYQLRNTSTEESQLEMLRRLELSPDMHRDLMTRCQDRGLLFLSSPFDEQSADLLDDLGVECFKIPSGEITNPSLLRHVARKGKPIILSTGMATLGEVEQAILVIEHTGNRDLALLHCVSNYPADPADINLRAMATMRAAFGVPVGYSDHSTGIEIPLAAVALGATIIEKHFTIDRNLPGPDHKASLEPEELTAMVRGIRKVEQALGNGRKAAAPSEADTAAVARKSLVAARDIPAGTVLTEEMIAILRPGTGLPPSMHSSLVGRTAAATIKAGSLLSLELLR